MADEELLNIINIIKKYDVYDVITRLASLNLLVENQNSAILLDALIAEILHAENLPGSTVKMSQGRFKKIVKELNSTSLNQFIDPVENPFIQNVMAYGNYKVFNGIDLVTAYNVQALGRVLSNQEKYPKEFMRKSWELITFCLQVSDYIAERVGTVQSKKIERECDGLIVPDAPTMSRYIELITIRGEFVRTLFQNDSDIIENLFDNFRPKIKDNIDNRTFYTRPFLFNEHKDEIILLNIALLPTYLVYSVLRLANQFGIKEQVIEDYNTHIFYDCKKYLKRLGHEKIKEQQFHIELSKDTTHREEVLNIHNNQFLILIYLCDDGDNYNSDSLHEVYDVKISDEEKRMLSIRKCLIDNHIPEEDIFYLLVVNEGLGRTISSSITSLNNIKYIQLSPFDLYCVSVNENSNPGFIPRYINAKFASGISILNIAGELNVIEYYNESGRTFYLGDDINPTDTKLTVLSDYAIYYRNRAIETENRHLITSYEKGFYLVCILKDKQRNIYIPLENINSKRTAEVIELANNKHIWICSSEFNNWNEYNIYKSVVDMTSYWLGEYSNKLEDLPIDECLIIANTFSGDINKYYQDAKPVTDSCDFPYEISFETSTSTLNVCWAPEGMWKMQREDNSGEKEYIAIILKQIIKNVGGEFDNSYFDQIFHNPFKKKFYSHQYQFIPYLKPVKLFSRRGIHIEDEDRLLQIIGEEMLSTGEWKIGIVPREKSSCVINQIVGLLYNKLQEEIRQLSPCNLVEIAYEDMEQTLYSIMLQQGRYASDGACYPEKKEQIFKDYNDLNKNSMAIRFFLEYISAQPAHGQKIVGQEQYEYILAICFMIIEWAYKNDLFYYNMIETPIEFLESKRLGLKHREFDELFSINSNYMDEELQYSSTFKHKVITEKKQNLEDYSDELNIAYTHEFGYTFDAMISVVTGLINYSRKIGERDVYVDNKQDLINQLYLDNAYCSEEIIEKIINDLSLTQRDDFLNPGKPYRKEDVYPWRFNRELSLFRKPLICRGKEIIWGERVVGHYIGYIYELLMSGKFRTHTQELNILLGKISDDRGRNFNNRIFSLLNKFDEFFVSKNVKEVNGLQIADKNGNELGDIDILIIDEKYSSIVAAEVKDFKMSKNPYEMNLEFEKMFVNKEKNTCYATKHQKRVNWIVEHLTDFIKAYELKEAKWNIYGLFIVNHPIISNKLHGEKITIISEAELSVDSIRRVYGT